VLPFDLVFTSALFALVFIDAEHMILPNVITYPGIVFGTAGFPLILHETHTRFVDRATFKEVKRIPLGAYPRGIVVNKASNVAYVAVMGSYNVARVDLNNFTVTNRWAVGSSPRHVVLSPDGSRLYVTLNGAGHTLYFVTSKDNAKQSGWTWWDAASSSLPLQTSLRQSPKNWDLWELIAKKATGE